MAGLHYSPFSGSWYPGDHSRLNELLGSLFEKSRERTGPYLLPNPRAFVVPHAGLIYSGTVAASAYRYLERLQPRRIIILGFAHRGGLPGVWVPEVEAFSTPLGEVPVDTTSVDFPRISEPVVCDHSVEIQLPLVQKACPNTRLVPLYVGQLDATQRAAAAKKLASLLDEGTVLLASSDFTHYGRNFSYQPFPPDDRVADRLQDLDDEVISAASSLDPDLFFETLQENGATVCGYNPIGLLLETMRSAGEDIYQEKLDYQTSGEITGDFELSVSYASLGYFPAESFALSSEDQELLLDSAKGTLRVLQQDGQRKLVRVAHSTPALSRRAAVFVTLHHDGKLRGCVGNRSARLPLSEAVPQLTLCAALDDVRFDPVTSSEDGIEIEISVLSPMKRTRDPRLLQVNVHGAYLEAADHRALLLPQVASERHWTADQFLAALSTKAGLPPTGYKEPSSHLYLFRAQVFGSR